MLEHIKQACCFETVGVQQRQSKVRNPGYPIGGGHLLLYDANTLVAAWLEELLQKAPVSRAMSRSEQHAAARGCRV